MATKKQSPGMALALSMLKKNPKADYAAIKAAAKKKNIKVPPIVFARAKALIGGGKASKATKRKATKRKATKSKATKRKATKRKATKHKATQRTARPTSASSRKPVARQPVRPRKSSRRKAPGFSGIDAIRALVDSVPKAQNENQRLRSTLAKINRLLEGAP